MKGLKFIGLWGLLFILCIIFRLPHLLSRNLFIDLDEATIGIMAKDVLQGKPIPYYFYLQNYGFSTIETLVTSFFIKLFGAGVWALKLAGICLYSLGGTFLLFYLENKQLKYFYWIGAIVIVAAFPSWYIWGSMMRGGYLTSFVCTSAVFYITQKVSISHLYVLICAILFYIAYESQILIFLPVFPLLMYWLWSRKFEIRKFSIFTLAFLFPLILGRLLFVNPYYGSVSLTISLKQLIKNIELLSTFFVEAFTNFYTYEFLLDIPRYWFVGAIILMATILLLILVVFIQVKPARVTIALICLGMIGALILSIFGNSFAPRYLLGFFTGVMLLLVYLIPYINGKMMKIGLASITLLIIIGVTAGSKIRRHWVNCQKNEIKELHALYIEVKRQKIQALYSIDKTFIWNYLYGEEIPSSGICGFDRTPQFFNELKKIEKKGGKIGLFGNAGHDHVIIDSNNDVSNFYSSTTYYLIPVVDSKVIQKAKSAYCESLYE